MTDDDLIGYALDLLDPPDRRAVERHLLAHPADAAKVERVRAALAPLAADRPPPEPAPGLAIRTLARVAEYVAEHEPRRADPVEPDDDDGPLAAPVGDAVSPRERTRGRPSRRGGPSWLRADVAVAAGIGVLAVGLVTAWVGKTRHDAALASCADNLRVLHAGLDGYSGTHGGRLPQVGDPAHPTAGTFAAALSEAGELPVRFAPRCPAAPVSATPTPVDYAYTLGYHGPDGELRGHERHVEGCADNDLIAVAADYPVAAVAPGGGPVSAHRTGHNVLYLGGNVRFATTATVGVNGDDIFRNDAGRVAAGLHRCDAALGRPADRP